MDLHIKSRSLDLEKNDSGVNVWNLEDDPIVIRANTLQKMLRKIIYPQRVIDLQNQIKPPIEYLP